jgi:hypothetical protein
MWRVGNKVPINVYEDDRPVCQCHNEIDAKAIVDAMNGESAIRELIAQAEQKGWTDCLRHVQASLEGYPNHGGDVEVMKVVSNLIAQATAEALEAAAQHQPMVAIEERVRARPRVWLYCSCGFNREGKLLDVEHWSNHIRALAPDIAAKAKERLSRHCCDICGQDLSGQDFDGHYTIVCHKPGCEGHLVTDEKIPVIHGAAELAEHDAKIRREVYLRCAEYNEDRYGEGSQFRKWANEPPSGGKADRGE